MGALHDALETSGYKGHPLERFLVRLLFCLFADDTGIFQPLGIFEDYVKNTREDGADVGAALGQLFQILNTPDGERHNTLSAELGQFPYINGDLFQENLPLPSFNRDMREKLCNVCGFRWEIISPAIFGSLFQSVMNKEERRKKGGHYTSERNILKVIEPLFMDDLKAEFARLQARRDTGRKKAIEEFHDKLSKLTFFDPACGCGNFLVIAYRELRDLEIAVLTERFGEDKAVLDVASLSTINVDQFYGIEIEEFPVRIAEVAMWMTDHIMNVRLSAAFGKSYLRIPLKKSPNIRYADALEIDWAEVLPPEHCSFIFGNPPFVGAKVQSEKQRAQITRIAALGGSGGSLDYVCAWFIKAGEYLRWSNAKIAFVATNSITQGEQVAQLWPVLFDRYKLEIAFAHRTFQWLSDARGMAHVHCVILGLVQREQEPKEKRLYSYTQIDGDPAESRHAALSPYLFDASRLQNRHLVVEEINRPIKDVKRPIIGSKPIDGGYYIFDEAECQEFVSDEPGAAKFMRPFVGAEDFVNGVSRYILALQDASPHELRSLPKVVDRIDRVRRYRLGEIPARRKAEDGETSVKKRGAGTIELAKFPTRFHVTVIPKIPYLVFPRHTSERQWLRNIGGRLESRYRYSIGIVYNPFPWPDADEITRSKIRALAQAVLDARKSHPEIDTC